MTPEVMAAVHAACFTTPRPWRVAEFSAFLNDPKVFCESSAGGFALGRVIAGEAELLTLAVVPEARREGRGRALLDAFEAAAAARGGHDGYLEVAATNNAARALYRGAGWAESGQRGGYYRMPDGRRIDAIIMGKTLG
ncbi:MAG: GNAT family N-acetyltransferase [Pseudooceanicola sp.]